MMVWLKVISVAHEYAPTDPFGQPFRPADISWPAMIHDENPFLDSPDQRDPIRRFRGRLAAPVTVVTSGPADQRVGLTVSSLNVMEGDPGVVQLVVGPASDLWTHAAETGHFVVHICREDDRLLAEVFAGLRPSPGGMFAGQEVTDTEWGPVLDRLTDRAYCRFSGRSELGYSGVLTGEIDRIETADLALPLVYFRGKYRTLD